MNKHKKRSKMSNSSMDDYSIDELMDIVKDSNAATVDRENAEYEIRWRAEMTVALAKGGDRPVNSPPNP